MKRTGNYFWGGWIGALLIMGIAFFPAQATHLRAGEIIVERVNCQSLTFKITVTVYTNTGSTVLFGTPPNYSEPEILEFGDGQYVIVPQTENTPRPDLGPNIGTASYTVYHTYPGPGNYMVRYREPNRNAGVLNMENSVNTTFYIETEINIDPYLGCNNTPQLLIPPIDEACVGVAFFHNPGAYDPDGDSLSYEMVIPFSSRNRTVIRYQDPNANSPIPFYKNYGIGNENANGSPTFSINPVTGTIIWDAPGEMMGEGDRGEYNIAFIVREWRKIDGLWIPLGFVRRDMQIVVKKCKNERPDLIVPKDTCVEAGTVLDATIFGIDPENHNVKIEAYSEIFNLAPAQSPATVSPYPPVLQASNPPAQLKFQWKTQCSHIKDQPYQVVFKITDNPPSGPKLVTFKTWQIRVIGPSPKWTGATVDLAKRQVLLGWENYFCGNAESMEVWRRVDSSPYVPQSCETGMPPFLGYELLANVPLKDRNNSPVTSFLDTNGGYGLAPGAIYCYRLVAVFPLPKGGKSVMSIELCVGPINVDEPVITNVSILKTDPSLGEVEVKWMPPFDIDPVQFPGPLTYIVQRAEGFTGGNYTNVHIGTLSTTSYMDVGINTSNKIFNYRILLVTPTQSNTTPSVVDTSMTASTVRLEARSQVNAIELSWNAFVPWSNIHPRFPIHDVYRGPKGTAENALTLVGSVNVTSKGYTYIDKDVVLGQEYCYKVMTRGAYGHPQIPEPLENLSQMLCAIPGDDVPPCKPSTPIVLNAPDCSTYTESMDFSCSQNIFYNKVAWARPTDQDCLNDIISYNVYVAVVQGGEFTLWATDVRDTLYLDTNLPSHARCYKVSAVDRSGNESDLSDAVCVDNCPYYELPNLLTLNGDCWNNVFSAFNDRPLPEDANPACGIPIENQKKCARFVERVAFKVFNRWGQEIYYYVGQEGSEKTIYIDWDGKDKQGNEVSPGVYYYSAEVTFNTVEPRKKQQTLKGWIHIMR